jgi:hypothetical protein
VYYLRLVSAMFLNDPLSTPRPAGGRPALIGIALSAALIVAFGIMPRPVFKFLERPRGDESGAATDEASLPPRGARVLGWRGQSGR